MTLLSTHAQRTHSLLTGEARNAPLHPIRRSPGAIRIGNQRIIVEPPRYWSQEMLQAQSRAVIDEYNASKQQRRPHRCASMEMGEYCPHATE